MKKSIVFLVVLFILSVFASPFGLSITANAQGIISEERISSLFDELSENLALSLITKDESSINNYKSKVTKIEQQLEAFGVNKLSNAELSRFLEEKKIPNTRDYITQPENTDTVTWYLYNYTHYPYNSKHYDIQRLVAVGNNEGGLLVTGKDNDRFFSNEEKLANAVSTAVGIYVQKAIGYIPIIKWTPYELLFSNAPSNTLKSSYVTHRCVSSIAFTFVKESSQSHDYFTLCFYSNKFSIAVTAHGAAVVDSVPITYSRDSAETVTADNFHSIAAAIQSYIGSGGRYDYITCYEMKSYDGQYTKTAYVPTPSVGPGQIY